VKQSKLSQLLAAAAALSACSSYNSVAPVLDESSAEVTQARREWLKDPRTQEWIGWVCTLPPGPERDREIASAKEKYGLILGCGD
jgi:hypothetical protein